MSQAKCCEAIRGCLGVVSDAPHFLDSNMFGDYSPYVSHHKDTDNF